MSSFPKPAMLGAKPTMLGALQKNWKSIARNSVIVGAAVAGVSLLLPNQFTATSAVLPPNNGQDVAGMLSSVPGAAALSRLAGLEMGGAETSLYIGIMRSTHILQHLVDRFDLVRVYGVRDRERARRVLASHTDITTTDEGIVRIAVTEKDRALAAKLANAYPEELDLFLRQSGHSAGRYRRQFLEKRIEETKVALSQAEDALRDYQIAARLPAMGTDVTRTAGEAGELLGRRAALEVELGTIQRVSRVPNPRAEELRTTIQQIDRQLARIPPATTTLGRLYREVKKQESILLVLTEEYERAKLVELKDTPDVQVLDRAEAPLHKSRPRRSFMVLAGLVVALVANSVLVWAREGALAAA